MSRYDILVNVLDKLRQEAPGSYKRYHPVESDMEKLNYSRSLAFIHLYLKATFDLSTFDEREKFITDGSGDAGIDAYYIDEQNKKIFFIQSKFRANKKNFEIKEIALNELLQMQTARIIDGDTADENGQPYSEKILKMIAEIKKIADIARYRYEVILLANVTKFKTSDLYRIAGLPTTVINYSVSYSKLLFPVLTGCCYNAEEITINLSLLDKANGGGKISYSIETQYNQCNVMVVFVPTIEIAKILDKYKNSILKFNPRCYLGLSKNEVNSQIEQTVVNKTTNEFALFNNGITILSDKTDLNEHIAVKGKAQVIIKNPQIINGGQTAYTLANLYRRILTTPKPGEQITMFDNKEVLVKIVTLLPDAIPNEAQKLQLIEDLSKATNQQSQVDDADRRANDKVLINYQDKIFEDFGYCYNRKKGEFYDSIDKNYITPEEIIDREIFIRVAASVNNQAAMARRSSDKVLFSDKHFSRLFRNGMEYRKYMFGYFGYSHMVKLERSFARQQNNPSGINTYGNALRYGKYAVINIVSKFYQDSMDLQDYQSYAIAKTNDILAQWMDFESHIVEESHNFDYFYQAIDEDEKTTHYANFDGYYKGKTLDYDLAHYDFKLPALT